MTTVLLILIAIIGYGFGGINCSILLSRKIFGKDIRRLGTHSASFENFSDTFGRKWALAVIGADALKTVIPCIIGMLLMKIPGNGYPKIGILFAGFCVVLGDCYPWRFRFKGNKGIVCCAAALWVADFRIGMIALFLYIIMIAFTRYISAAGLVMAAIGPLLCLFFLDTGDLRGQCALLALFMAVIVIFRQRKSLGQILSGKEKPFQWGRKVEDVLKEDRF